MEADLYAATIENQNLQRANALMDMELTHLRSQLVVLQSERDDAMIKCAEMRTIMESVSSGLVTGLGRMKFTQRQRQERVLGVNDQSDRTPYTPPAEELPEPAPAPLLRSPSLTREVRRAAEMIAPATPFRPGRVDPTLADRDPRLPPNQFERSTEDEESLRRLSERMQTRTGP
jgi:hypothetical protein